MTRYMHRYGHILLLVLVLLTAAGFRFYELQWDREMDAFPHPDERHLANTMSHVSLSWPPDWRNLLDPDHSSLNPRRINPEDPAGGHYDLAYGTLPVYLYRFLTVIFPGRQGEYRQFFVVGRTTTALLSLLTVLLVYLLGRTFWGRREGLLGAALLALSVTHIQLSHFMTVDIALTAFGTAAVYAGARLVARGGWWRALLMGLMVGCAAACKVSGFTYGAVILAAGLLVLLRPGEERLSRRLARAAGYMALAGLGVALAFGTFEFYALLDPGTYLEAIGRQAEMVRGEVDWPYTRQYVNTTPYVYHLSNLLRWGLGWALGIAGLAGVLAALIWLVWAVTRRPAGERGGTWERVQAVTREPARWGLFLVLAWALPYFFQVGGYEVKFVRYMVPLVPFLCLLAAWLMVRLADAAGRLAERLPATAWGRSHLPRLGAEWALEGRRWHAVAGGLVISLVLVPTLLWALAFMQVYARPHTWYQASRWIYANVPDGAALSEEIWDDSLPVSLPAEGESPGQHGYRHVAMDMYHDMPPEEKLQHIAGVLHQVDYVVLTTPRLYGSIRRLPWRYPVEIRYYELLFQGRLGFELAYSATSYPRLWGKEFPDDAADESFSVYDHPKVLIFRKVRDLSEEEFRSLFADALQSTPLVRRDVKEPPAELPVPAYRKSLMLDRPVDELPAVHDWAWNPLANAGTLPAVLVWLVVLMLVGLAGWPLAALLFPDMPGRGYGLARGLGLLAVAYFCWLAASLRLWKYTAGAAWLSLALLFAIGWLLFRWRRLEVRELWRRHRREVLFSEAAFLAGFGVFLLLRLLNPDLWHPLRGGEKPMEFGFLNAILRSAWMPPYDPFFSDGYINYYYYGLFAVSTLIKLAGVRPSIGFNLLIPTLAGLTTSGAFVLGWTLTGRRRFGAAAAGFVALIGNLAGAFPIRGYGGLPEVAQALRSLADGHLQGSPAGILQGLARWIAGAPLPLRTDWFWDASRAHGAYENTITEFPFFSFLFADLHPHVISLPFAILLIALLVSLVRSVKKGEAAGDLPLILALPVTAWVLGTMAVNNMWDFPVYLMLTTGALLLAHWAADARFAGRRLPEAVLAAGLGAGLLGAAGLALYAPFFTYFQAFVHGLGQVTYPTEANYYLGMFGFFLYPLAGLTAGMALARLWRWWQAESRRRAVPALPAESIIGHGALYLEEELDEFYEAVSDGRLAPASQGLAEMPETEARPPAFRFSVWWAAGLAVPVVSAALLPLMYGRLNGLQILTFIIIGELALGALWLVTRHDLPIEERLSALLMLMGLLVCLGVEIVYVRDHLGGTYYRMNTIFKFYMQAWVLMGLGSAGVLAMVVRRLAGRAPLLQGAWWAGFSILLALSLVYPVFASYTRVHDRFPVAPPIGTLDGQAYMGTAEYVWEGHPIFMAPDYDAIRWLEEHIEGTPVILQAPWEFYRANGVRIAWNTSFPTVINPLHENEQRYPELIPEREQDVHRIYSELDPNAVLPLLRQYHVGYIYVGPFERAVYPAAGLAKFAGLAGSVLDLVYDSGEVQIYAVRRQALGTAAPAAVPLVVPTVSPEQETRRVEAELERLRRLADANPSDAGLQFELGNRLRQLGRYEEAVEVFRRSLQHHPEDVAMYHTLGDTYQEMGRPDDALQQYQAAVNAAPQNPAAYNKLGMALRDRGRLPEAEAAFRQAIAVAPEFAEAYYHLGEVLEEMGRRDEAGELYRRLVELAPQSDWGTRAAERLRALGQAEQ